MEHQVRLAVEPLTWTQCGAIHGEFRRLGFRWGDRADRLAISAKLARFPGELSSTKDLTMGEAGRLINALRGCRNAADLIALVDPPIIRDATPWRETLAAFAVALYGISNQSPRMENCQDARQSA